jgi:Resolvase, N terminal domain
LTERPALQRLLADIRDRRIDIVVVYKVDRLTRSLADFAKLVARQILISNRQLNRLPPCCHDIRPRFANQKPGYKPSWIT